MKEDGMSLIEILIVVTIFAILGIITTRAIFLTLQGSKKSESTVKVRENLNYSLGVIERQLRNANSVVDCSANVINYTDQNGNPASFSCVNTGSANSYIASGSARLTGDSVNIISCEFNCPPTVSTNPPEVTISLEAQGVSLSTQIFLRSY